MNEVIGSVSHLATYIEDPYANMYNNNIIGVLSSYIIIMSVCVGSFPLQKEPATFMYFVIIETLYNYDCEYDPFHCRVYRC